MEKDQTKQADIKAKDAKKKENELSEEDKQLKEQIEFTIEKIRDTEMLNAERLKYLNDLFEQIRTVKSSRVSLPKEIRFLKPLYPELVVCFEAEKNDTIRRNLADFLSLTCLILSDNYNADSLRYLKAGTGTLKLEDLGDEYLVNLAGDLAIEFDKKYAASKDSDFSEILTLAEQILPLLCSNGHEISAVDLLLEVEKLELIYPYLNASNYARIFQYLNTYLDYTGDNFEFESVLNTLYTMALKQNDSINALRVAIRLNDRKRIEEVYFSCKDDVVKKQLCFNLARHRIFLQGETHEENLRIMSNSMLPEYFIVLCKDLDVLNPKTPKDIYKGMIEDKSDKIDSALLNLGDSFVNGLVNIGTCRETLLDAKHDKPWIQRVKDAGIMSTVASLGMVYMWNFEEFSTKISDYFDLKDGYAKAGACIALGLSSGGIWDESDPAKALLEDALSSNEECMKVGATIGLGLAYAASSREDIKDLLSKYINDENAGLETSVNAALSLSLVFVSDGDEDLINTILTSLMTFPKEMLNKPFAKFFGVALAINFLGQQEKCSTILEALDAVEHPIAKHIKLCVEVCAYIGSGNVMKIQEYMERATQHTEKEDEINDQVMGLIGVALIAVSEVVGTKMVIRNVHHILQYCSLEVKRAAPIMLAIIGIKDSNIQVQDLLYKLAHDEDKEMSFRAILALGIIGAGTNNSRIGGLLRNLAQYNEAEDEYIYITKIALGILHAGKGLVGLNPYYSEDFLYSKTSFAGIFILINAMTNVMEFLIKENHYLFYYVATAFYPKMLFLLDENLNQVKTNVRVGQALDTVAQVGQPRKITGFQTHISPVIINNGERAELGTEEYIVATNNIMENFVIVKKNPDYAEEEPKDRKKTSFNL